ncbi:FbpB family small basic protein [Alkalihalobacillus algicola]|nr:FbpB family small basic protein [Alkalihalobacillus sp. CinArs1]MCA0986722.1 FbpB family small basic protein [Alkalihalobacillus algicola]
MVKKHKKLTFKQLVEQNKAELLKNEKELAEIEKRLDDKHS